MFRTSLTLKVLGAQIAHLRASASFVETNFAGASQRYPKSSKTEPERLERSIFLRIHLQKTFALKMVFKNPDAHQLFHQAMILKLSFFPLSEDKPYLILILNNADNYLLFVLLSRP